MRPRAMLEARHGGELPSSATFIDVEAVGAGDVIVSAVKGAEDADGGNGLVIRCYEASGRPGKTTATITLPFQGRQWETELRQHQIRTFLVPAEPADAPVREVNLVEWEETPQVSDDGTAGPDANCTRNYEEPL